MKEVVQLSDGRRADGQSSGFPNFGRNYDRWTGVILSTSFVFSWRGSDTSGLGNELPFISGLVRLLFWLAFSCELCALARPIDDSLVSSAAFRAARRQRLASDFLEGS